MRTVAPPTSSVFAAASVYAPPQSKRDLDAEVSVVDSCEHVIGALHMSAQWLLIVALASAGLAVTLPPTAPVALAVGGMAAKMGVDFESVMLLKKFRDWSQERLERHARVAAPRHGTLSTLFEELDEIEVSAPSPAPAASPSFAL